MKQVTLVSLYGEKTEALAALIKSCIDRIIASSLRTVFRPYDIRQVHGTVVGMGKLVGYTEHFNANLWRYRKEKKVMQFGPLFGLIRDHFPMTVQVGGFGKSFVEFDSFGRWPYERSFQVQWATRRVTLIGWPHEKRYVKSNPLLLDFRNKVEEQCHIKHRYKEDNDLYMVLGELKDMSNIDDRTLAVIQRDSARVEEEVREFLVGRKTLTTIEQEDVFVVQYEKETLPLDSSIAHRIVCLEQNAKVIENLY